MVAVALVQFLAVACYQCHGAFKLDQCVLLQVSDTTTEVGSDHRSVAAAVVQQVLPSHSDIILFLGTRKARADLTSAVG